MDSKTVCVYIAVITVFWVPCLVTTESEHAMVTQGACPYPCTQGGRHYCHPLPCPLPPCAYPVKDAGACCSHCRTGPTCEIHGQVVPEGQNITTNAQWCACRRGGDTHRAVVICSRCFYFGGGLGMRCV